MVKRTFDCLTALILLIVLSPIMLLTAILVRIFLGKPVLFRQERPGLNGKLFILMKFRTMNDKRNDDGELLPDGLRLTRFGQFLRRTSLDELPQLFNVLKGDMSLVGPRPLLPEYLPLYTKDQARRHEVRPGITGHAQVNGRNLLTWEEKFELDVWYVDHQSFWLDLKILLKTVVKVFVARGVNQQGSATAEKFRGVSQ